MADLKITTRNSRFQLLEALTRNRSHRTREHRFVVQGVRPISQAVEHGWTILTAIYDTGRSLSPWARDIVALASETIAMSAALLAELADKDEGATEVIAVVSMPDDELSRIPVPADFLDFARVVGVRLIKDFMIGRIELAHANSIHRAP